MRTAPITLALTIGLFLGSAEEAIAEKSRYHVVVVPAGSVPRIHLKQVDLALRRGVTEAGGEVLNLPAGTLPRAADPQTGECSEECEALMRSKPIGGALVLARVSAASERFVLRVSVGLFRSDSAFGLISQLDERATRVGRRIASPESVLVLKGGAKEAQWFLDGRAIALGADRMIRVSPGRHVVRLGAGSGPGAIKSVDVVHGDRVVLTFADGADGLPSSGSRVPSGVRPPAPVAVKQDAARDAWSSRTGITFVSRARSISGRGGAGYSTRFLGGGPEVSVLYRPRLGIVRLDIGMTSYRLSSARFGSAQNNVTVHGGDSMRAQGVVGYEHDFGGRWSLAGYGGGGWESHRADDPRGVRLSPSYQRISLDAEVAASIRLGFVRMKRPPTMGAHFGLAPWSSWRERPDGSSGVNARADLGVSWGARSSVPIHDRWEGVVSYRGELRSVRFGGTARAQVNPTIEDATIQELFNTVAISLKRSF